MVKTKELSKKNRSVKTYIALAVFAETSINAVFAILFDRFLNFFYSDYAHLTVWGDVVAIVSVAVSFIIYDSFAHAAYHKRRDRIMFLGVVYVASKAASIIHYLTGILVEIFTAGAGDTVQSVITVALAVMEIAVDVTAAIWLMGYFEKKFAKEEKYI